MLMHKFFVAMMFVFGSGPILVTSCAAEYQTLHAGGGGGLAGDGNGPSADDLTPSDSSLVTAQLEVVHNGQVVSRVPVGAQFTVRPSAETRDVLYEQDQECPHPGIVSATFLLDQHDDTEIIRNEPCDPIATEKKYDEAGSYRVAMVVKAKSGQEAQSSLTLEVYDPEQEDDLSISFWIRAEPMIAKPGEDILFSGECTAATDTSISWNLGDQSLRQGSSVTHRYQRVGAYQVTARCLAEDGTSATSSLTVVIVPSETQDSEAGEGGSGSGQGAGSGTSTGQSGEDGDDPSSGKDHQSGQNDPKNNGTSGSNPQQNDPKPGESETTKDDMIDDTEDQGVVNPGNNPGQNPTQNPGQN